VPWNRLLTSAKFRKISIVIFFVLSLAIILYPTQYFFGFSNTDGFNIFPFPEYFALLYGLWIAISMLISIKASRLLGGILGVTISIVSSLLLYKIAPLGFDHNYDITYYDSSYLQTTHFLPFSIALNSQYNYLAYPGLSIITCALHIVLGLNYQGIAPVLMTAFYTVLGLSIYRLTSYLTKNVMLSVISMPIFFSMSLGSLYYLLFPATLGLTLLGLSISFLFTKSDRSNGSSMVLILLVTSMIVTHFYDPILLIFVFLLILIFRKQLKLTLQPVRIMIVLIAIDAIWNVYIATNYTTSIIELLKSTLNGSFSYALTVITSNTSGGLISVNMLRYFDLLISSVFGVILSIVILATYKKREFTERLYSIAAIAAMIFGFTATIGSLAQGGFDFTIALQFVPLLSIPLFLSFFAKNRRRIAIIIAVVVILSGLSLFVLPYHAISSTTVYPSEFTVAGFYLHYTTNNATAIMTDPKTFGIIGAEAPLINGNIYSYPVRNLGYDPYDYNIINLGYVTYQMHLYSYAINISDYNNYDITFTDGRIFLCPPSP